MQKTTEKTIFNYLRSLLTTDQHLVHLCQYKIKNHLGNVRATVTDRRLPEVSSGNIDDFRTEIEQWGDDYAFGAKMPGRNANPTDYRFGYQGSEKTDEIKGISGSHYTTQFRELDPRIARWWSIDPKAQKFPNLSPYISMDNNPVWRNDPLGDVPDKYYDKEGNKLGEDNAETDDIRIMDKNKFNMIDEGFEKGKERDKMLQSMSAKVDESEALEALSPESWVNIVNDNIKGMTGFKRLQNKSISASQEVFVDDAGGYIGIKSIINNGSEGARGSSTAIFSTDKQNLQNGDFKVTMFFKRNGNPRAPSLISTSSNIKNLVGVHEMLGHGVLNYSGSDKEHSKLLKNVQMEHPTWEKTTPMFKKHFKNKY